MALLSILNPAKVISKGLGGEWQGYFRLRIGDYRIIMAIAPEEITLMRVRHRSEAYR